uniref:hypothetical protein n=1 Tax=Klebsiella pneumoniae TaxID=573 RepID=UPI0025A078E6
EEVRAKKALSGMKKQRAITLADVTQAVLEVSSKKHQERGLVGYAAQPKNTKKSTVKPDISI